MRLNIHCVSQWFHVLPRDKALIANTGYQSVTCDAQAHAPRLRGRGRKAGQGEARCQDIIVLRTSVIASPEAHAGA